MVDGVQGNRNDGVVPNLVNVLANANEKDLISERSIFLELDKDRNGEITKKEIKSAEDELNGLKDFAQKNGWSELLDKAIENLKNLASSFMQKKATYHSKVMDISQSYDSKLVDMPEIGLETSLRNVDESHFTYDMNDDGVVDSTIRSVKADFETETGYSINKISTRYFAKDNDGDGNADEVKYNQAINNKTITGEIRYEDGKKIENWKRTNGY